MIEVQARRPIVTMDANEKATATRKVQPSTLEELRKAINAAVPGVRTAYFVLLLVGLYITLFVGSTTDEQLLRADNVSLPLLNVSLSIVGAYAVAPWLFVLLHFYLLLQIALLAETCRAYDEASNIPTANRQRDRRLISQFVFPQAFARVGDGLLSALLRLIAWLTVAVLPVAVLLMVQIRFLPYHDRWITGVHQGAVIVDLFLLWTLWRKAIRHAQHRGKLKLISRLARWSFATLASVFVVLYATADAVVPREDSTKLECEFQLIKDVASSVFELIKDLVTKQNLTDCVAKRHLNLRERVLVAEAPPVALLAEYYKDRAAIGLDWRTQAWLDFAKPISLVDRDLRFAVFTEAQLIRADLRGADLRHAFLYRADLNGANLDPSTQRRTNLRGATLMYAQLQGASLSYARMQRATLERAQLRGAILYEAELQGNDLIDAQLQGARLKGVRLERADLTRAMLQGADLAHAQMVGANLSGASLQGADLQEAQLQAAGLDGADLRGADLRGAQLQGASLRGARLQGADFSTGLTALDGADLRGVHLAGTDFRLSHIGLVDFRGATLEFLPPERWDDIKITVQRDVPERRVYSSLTSYFNPRQSALERIEKGRTRAGQMPALVAQSSSISAPTKDSLVMHDTTELTKSWPKHDSARYTSALVEFLAELPCQPEERQIHDGYFEKQDPEPEKARAVLHGLFLRLISERRESELRRPFAAKLRQTAATCPLLNSHGASLLSTLDKIAAE